MTSNCVRMAETLNRDCQCVSVDREKLLRALAQGEAGADMVRLIEEERPHCSPSTVFLSRASVERMAEIIAAIERGGNLGGRVLAWAPRRAMDRRGRRLHGLRLPPR
jgi:hypothetical protein